MMNPLPRKEDINVYDSLDERSAVREFYGKTREQIFKELIDGYQYLQESLAFMGPVGFAYYAPAWERLFTHFEQVEELEEIAQWTKCIISIRCNSLDTETPESVAALHRMLELCEKFYHSDAYLNYNIEEARLYGYAESLLSSPLDMPEVQAELKECTRLRKQLNA